MGLRMLDRLDPQPPDALLALIKIFAADERSEKIDLGVGIYRTDEGDTPVFEAIKGAEKRLLEEQDTKAYLGPAGDMGFVNVLMPLAFGENATMSGRMQGMQTPGGTGAVRLAAALARQAGVRRVLLGVPSWPNHAQILDDLGLEVVAFDHSSSDGTANLDALEQAVADAGEGDAVLLHACCHNPTGIDYSDEQWERITELLVESRVLPIIDIAYQGLGRGMNEDAAGMRKVLAAGPEALVAYSCDKNFGLYRDRVGAFFVMAERGEGLDTIMSNANALARANWSMPPDHGGAAVRIALRDGDLTEQWRTELAGMRHRMRAVRQRLAAADNEVRGIDLAQLAGQNGLFAVLPLDQAQIQALRRDHAVYMAGSGRINIAGLHKGNIDRFVEVLKQIVG